MKRDEFEQFLKDAYEAGWISDAACGMHGGPPLTEDEDELMEEGFDPCVPIVRLYEDGDGPGPTDPAAGMSVEDLRFDDNLDLADVLTVEDILGPPPGERTEDGAYARIEQALKDLIEPELEEAFELELRPGRWVAVVEYIDSDDDSIAVRALGNADGVERVGLLKIAEGLG